MCELETNLNAALDKLWVKRRMPKPLYRLSINNAGLVAALDTADLQGIPILAWRKDPRLSGMKRIIDNQLVAGISTIKALVLEHRNINIRNLVYRELDICQWLSCASITHVYALQCGNNTMDLIARLNGGMVCTLELAANLDENEQPVFKHEVITRKGVVMDKTVDTQAVQNSVYLFGEDSRVYNDPDYDLYGLSFEEVLMARYVLDMLADPVCAGSIIEYGNALNKTVDAVFESVKTGCRVAVA